MISILIVSFVIFKPTSQKESDSQFLKFLSDDQINLDRFNDLEKLRLEEELNGTDLENLPINSTKSENKTKISNLSDPILTSKKPDTKSKCGVKDPSRLAQINDYISKNKDKLTEEDIKLISFISGSCNPIVVIPGLYGTRLDYQVTDCTKLKKNHPNLFKECGFNKKCEVGQEDRIWINDRYITEGKGNCSGELMKINYQKQSDGHWIDAGHKGIKITFYGSTEKSKSDSKCGFGATSNILKLISYFFQKSPRGLKDMRERFEDSGYQVGINLFAVPVDFRRAANEPYNEKMIKDTVDLAYRLNNKKVILIGHSYGGTMGASYIYNLSEDEKSKKLARYITIASPQLGVAQVIQGAVFGSKGFNTKISILSWKILNLYISISNQKIMNSRQTLQCTLFRNNFLENNKDEDWMKIIMNRSDIEDSITTCVKNLFNQYSHLKKIEDSLVTNSCISPLMQFYETDLKLFEDMFPFYPKLEPGCDNKNLYTTTFKKDNSEGRSFDNIWDSYCRLNFYNPYKKNTVEITDEEGKLNTFKFINKSDQIRLIEKFGFSTTDLEFLKYKLDRMNPHLETLEHPNVPITVIHTTRTFTDVAYKSPINPRIFTDKNEYVEDHVDDKLNITGGGDGTVEAISSLLVPLRWAKLYSDGHGKYPIDFINYCGDTNYKGNGNNKDGNSYSTIGCRCDKPLAEACTHSSMVGDPHLLDSLEKYAFNGRLGDEEFKESIDLVKRNVNNSEKMNCENLKEY